MSFQDKQINNRVTAAPELGPSSDIVIIPANAGAGTAESLMAAIKARYAAATALELDAGGISGLLFCPGGAAFLRTTKTGAASGVPVATGERFYIPNPTNMTNDLQYECASACVVMVFH